MKKWSKRFLSSTRGQVVQLLRRENKTVNELAEALDVTDNAVRSHLSTLQRDGLVKQAGKRPGFRKPETLYALTSDAEQLFPKAYHLLLNELLSALDDRLEPAEVRDILREVGRNLAPHSASGRAESFNGNAMRKRAEEAVTFLGTLGGGAELHESNDELSIRGYSCPLAAAVREHPEVCELAEALLTEIIGVPVHEACDRSGAPRCIFQIEANAPRP